MEKRERERGLFDIHFKLKYVLCHLIYSSTHLSSHFTVLLLINSKHRCLRHKKTTKIPMCQIEKRYLQNKCCFFINRTVYFMLNKFPVWIHKRSRHRIKFIHTDFLWKVKSQSLFLLVLVFKGCFKSSKAIPSFFICEIGCFYLTWH